MHDNSLEIMSIIVTILLVVALVIGAKSCSSQHDKELWNNGRCDVCGGTWKYEQAVGHRYSTSYIYVCEDCSNRIEISNIK